MPCGSGLELESECWCEREGSRWERNRQPNLTPSHIRIFIPANLSPPVPASKPLLLSTAHTLGCLFFHFLVCPSSQLASSGKPSLTP